MTESKVKCVFFKGVCIIPVDRPAESQCATVYEEMELNGVSKCPVYTYIHLRFLQNQNHSNRTSKINIKYIRYRPSNLIFSNNYSLVQLEKSMSFENV